LKAGKWALKKPPIEFVEFTRFPELKPYTMMMSSVA